MIYEEYQASLFVGCRGASPRRVRGTCDSGDESDGGRRHVTRSGEFSARANGGADANSDSTKYE
jgi:hypothetical protein